MLLIELHEYVSIYLATAHYIFSFYKKGTKEESMPNHNTNVVYKNEKINCSVWKDNFNLIMGSIHRYLILN